MDVKTLWRYGHGVFLMVFLIDWVILNFTVLYSQLFSLPYIRPKLYWASLKMLSCTHLCFRNTTIAIVSVISKISQWKVAADYTFLGNHPKGPDVEGWTHTHSCMHRHTRARVLTHMHIYRHPYIHTHTCTSVHTHACMHTCSVT